MKIKRTQEEQAIILANYLRNDKLHESKYDTNSSLYKVLLGLASAWIDFQNNSNQIIDNYNINNSLDLLDEWEKAVGIPDDIFIVENDIERRRRNILLKIAGSKASTKQQFEKVASLLGFNVIVETGYKHCVFPLTFPIIFATQEAIPFLIIVTIDNKYQENTLPLTFPIQFKPDGANILKLFFNKIKPANTQIIFRYGSI